MVYNAHMNAETDKTRDELEIQQIRMETRKMFEDINHNTLQRDHDYDALRSKVEHEVEERYHWKAQRLYWGALVIVAVVAIAVSPFVKNTPDASSKTPAIASAIPAPVVAPAPNKPGTSTD